jgi:acyl phosphate:glycerol-3-phosphate acyltransferase
VLVLTLCVAYLLGSFPTGVVLSRLFGGDDVRTHGSGNPGASNVARTYGFKLGAAVGATDILKGLLAVVLGRWLGVSAPGLAFAAAAAVVGHDYSVFLRFGGGKGVATTLGAGVALLPAAGIVAMIAWALTIVVTRYSSLASLVALAALPVAIALFRGDPAFVWITAALFGLALWKHRENISRLWNGTERKFRSLNTVNGA